MDEEFSKDEAVVIALPEAASIYDAGWRSYVFLDGNDYDHADWCIGEDKE